MKKLVLLSLILFGAAALAAPKGYVPTKTSMLANGLKFYSGAWRLTDEVTKKNFDKSLNNIFKQLQTNCKRLEHIFWFKGEDANEITNYFYNNSRLSGYKYEELENLDTAVYFNLMAGKVSLYGLWNYNQNTTTLSLCSPR